MCNRLTKLSVTMWYTFFGIFDDTSLWILPKTHDPSLCDTPDDLFIYLFIYYLCDLIAIWKWKRGTFCVWQQDGCDSLWAYQFLKRKYCLITHFMFPSCMLLKPCHCCWGQVASINPECYLHKSMPTNVSAAKWNAPCSPSNLKPKTESWKMLKSHMAILTISEGKPILIWSGVHITYPKG